MDRLLQFFPQREIRELACLYSEHNLPLLNIMYLTFTFVGSGLLWHFDTSFSFQSKVSRIWSGVELRCFLRTWAWIRTELWTFWTKMLRNWTDQKLSNLNCPLLHLGQVQEFYKRTCRCYYHSSCWWQRVASPWRSLWITWLVSRRLPGQPFGDASGLELQPEEVLVIIAETLGMMLNSVQTSDVLCCLVIWPESSLSCRTEMSAFRPCNAEFLLCRDIRLQSMLQAVLSMFHSVQSIL